MSRLSDKFAELKARNEAALVLFFTAGDQPLSELPAIVDALTAGGADVIEVGIPFSDPFGEGPTIQASSQRSLDNGSTPLGILDALGRCNLAVPVVTMGYYNPVLRIGLDRYAEASKAAGSSGTIVSDLVPDESGPWLEACRRAELDTIFLVAPTSTGARIEEVATKSSGFVYAVSRTGVTGAGQEVPPEVRELVARIRTHTDKPICVGFGVSTPDHVRMIAGVADGAVVGSWLVDLLHRRWDGGAGREEIVAAVSDLKAATRH